MATGLSALRGFRVFSSAVDAARVRRPTDVVLLIAATLATIGIGLAAPGPTAVDDALVAITEALSSLSGWLWEICYALLAVWAGVLLLMALVSRGRRRLLVDYLVGGVLALGFSLLAGAAAGTPVSESFRSLTSSDPPAVYVAVRVALATAIVVTASPHVARPLRYVGRVTLVLGATAAVALAIALPIGATAGFLIGVGSAAIAHLIFGSPGGRPTPGDVTIALGDLGIEAHDVAEASVELSGVALFSGTTSAGEPLLIKVYGRDAWDGQLLTSTWSALQTRGETPQIGVGRLELVEHESVATLIAERAGVPVLPVLAVGRSDDGDALLVNRSMGVPFEELPADAVDDDLVRATWTTVEQLHAIGIAHGHVDRDSIVVGPDRVPRLADFSRARVAADTSFLMADRAQLLVTTALTVGHERAVACATDIIGTDGLTGLLPLLQPAVLDRPTLRMIDASPWSLDDLRSVAVAATGVEPPELQKLRRVTLRSVLSTVLIAVIAYFLITQLAGVDFASVWAELSSADFAWLLAALLLSPVVQVSYSIGTLGASMAPLRYWPVLMLQYAIQFIALVLPATAARLALEIRFFERYGIAAAAAVSIGVVDSVSGFAVQIALLLLIGLSGLPGFTSSITGSTSTTSTTTTDTSSTPSLMALAIALIFVGVFITLVVPRFRNRIRTAIPRWRETAKSQAASARNALAVLRHPSKVGQMLVGNLGAQVLQAIILGLCLQAFGYDAHLSQLILINTAVSLFAGLMPVPGGMGVAEAGYTAGLQAIGIPSAVAISTAIAFRLVTFYLPPLWGSVAMRWLRRNSYV